MKNKITVDEKIIIITAKTADEFVLKVNKLLEEGDWRIVQTEMAVPDNHYFAMAIKQESEHKSRL